MEENIQPFDLQRMFLGEQSLIFLLEVAFRTGFMYLFALFAARVIGKRGMSQLTPFEYIIIIALGSAVGDPMFYPQVPLIHGVIVLAVVAFLQRLIAELAQRSEKVQNFTESSPSIVIKNGEFVEKEINKERLTREDLMMRLRTEGIKHIDEVSLAVLEPSGKLSVFKDDHKNKDGEKTTYPESKKQGK